MNSFPKVRLWSAIAFILAMAVSLVLAFLLGGLFGTRLILDQGGGAGDRAVSEWRFKYDLIATADGEIRPAEEIKRLAIDALHLQSRLAAESHGAIHFENTRREAVRLAELIDTAQDGLHDGDSPYALHAREIRACIRNNADQPAATVIECSRNSPNAPRFIGGTVGSDHLLDQASAVHSRR